MNSLLWSFVLPRKRITLTVALDEWMEHALNPRFINVATGLILLSRLYTEKRLTITGDDYG